MLFVLIDGMSGLRKADALVVPTYCVSVTGPMRAILEGAAYGSSAVWPNTLWPLVTLSRFVPSAAISAFTPAAEDDDRPSTATIAATPMAMPREDRAARKRRVRRPTLATRNRSPGDKFFGASVRPFLMAGFHSRRRRRGWRLPRSARRASRLAEASAPPSRGRA